MNIFANIKNNIYLCDIKKEKSVQLKVEYSMKITMENINVVNVCQVRKKDYYHEVNIIKYKGKVFKTNFLNKNGILTGCDFYHSVYVLTDNNGWANLADRHEICPDLNISYTLMESEFKAEAKKFLTAVINYLKIIYD